MEGFSQRMNYGRKSYWMEYGRKITTDEIRKRFIKDAIWKGIYINNG
jgi:hypothetical protein